MERYRQQFPKLIAMEDWLAGAHPDAPALPWRADNGEEVCSFMIQTLTEVGGKQVLLFDAHGREVVRSADVDAIKATALALQAEPGKLVFLPVAAALMAGCVDPAEIPRSMEGEGLSVVRGEYTEAGWFGEANVVKLTDGERTALYEPFRTVRG